MNIPGDVGIDEIREFLETGNGLIWFRVTCDLRHDIYFDLIVYSNHCMENYLSTDI